MKRILILVILSIASRSHAQERKAQALFEQLVTDQGIVGAASAYSINGETIWASATGYSNLETKKTYTLETTNRMASIAKPMTAIAIMQLFEKGLIDLDSPIQTYIPDYPNQGSTQITIRHLLSHTSGIDGYKNSKEAENQINYPTLSDAIGVFKNRSLLFEPGTSYHYTSYGYTLLGHLLEHVTGLSYESYMQQNIWDVADMNDTGIDRYGVDEGEATKLYSRRKSGKTIKGRENNLSNRIPGGGFYTTVDDMLKFGHAVLTNELIKKETFDFMRELHSVNTKSQYGFGWFLYSPAPNQGSLIGHGGAQMGCSSQLFILPDQKIVSIVLANTSRVEVTGFGVELIRLAIAQN